MFETQDITTSRANTLFDDADDIQKQLDNEARDKMKYGKVWAPKYIKLNIPTFILREAKTIWVFHLPTQHSSVTKMYRHPRDSDLPKKRVEVCTEYISSALFASVENQWDYKDQEKWKVDYQNCGGQSQSPVSLPQEGLVQVKRGRQMVFRNHDVLPKSLDLVNDGKSVKLTGIWHALTRPVIYGGAANSRRYLFDSILLHWPSEHTISGLQFPLESQALYVSAEYQSIKEALNASSDKMALLGVASLYKFSNHTQDGLQTLLTSVLKPSFGHKSLSPRPLSYFHPPFKEYVCYHGSLTTPPCTESVLWMVRARSLPVTRELVDAVQEILVNGETQQVLFRQTQPLNDRKIYFFH